MYRTDVVTLVSNTSFVSHSYFLFISGQENCNLSKRNCITMAGPTFHYILLLKNTFAPFFNVNQQRTVGTIKHGLECKPTIKIAKMHFSCIFRADEYDWIFLQIKK